MSFADVCIGQLDGYEYGVKLSLPQAFARWVEGFSYGHSEFTWADVAATLEHMGAE